MQRIAQASARSREVCGGLDGQMSGIETKMCRTTAALDAALRRTDGFLRISEQLIEAVAECGVATDDTPFIRGAQQAAAQVAKLLEYAVRTGAITVQDLFDESYQAVAGSNPAQVTTRFVALAERLFPQVQERMLALSDKVVYCIAVDRNGYVACHNQQCNQRPRSGDTVWNTAHCRNRRIFNDSTGMASGRNQRPFLLQTYRRDMGGGHFVVMKEVAAPIAVNGRHGGGPRLAFTFGLRLSGAQRPAHTGLFFVGFLNSGQQTTAGRAVAFAAAGGRIQRIGRQARDQHVHCAVQRRRGAGQRFTLCGHLPAGQRQALTQRSRHATAACSAAEMVHRRGQRQMQTGGCLIHCGHVLLVQGQAQRQQLVFHGLEGWFQRGRQLHGLQFLRGVDHANVRVQAGSAGLAAEQFLGVHDQLVGNRFGVDGELAVADGLRYAFDLLRVEGGVRCAA